MSSNVHVEMHAVLRSFLLGDLLEEQSRSVAIGIDH